MSPSYFSGEGVYVRFVFPTGQVGSGEHATFSHGVRPVINLKPNSLKQGDGSASNPYTVE